MNIPLKIVAGDTVTWYEDETTDGQNNVIKPSTHTLHLALLGPTQLTINSTVENSRWKMEISGTDSSNLAAGTYYFQLYALDLTLKKSTLVGGALKVEASLIGEDPNFDGRTQAKKDLDAVQAAIRSIIAGGAVAEYTIGNRSLRKLAMTDLLTLESKLKADVVREDRVSAMKNGLGNPYNLLIRFK